jgi:hypothetical protein
VQYALLDADAPTTPPPDESGAPPALSDIEPALRGGAMSMSAEDLAKSGHAPSPHGGASPPEEPEQP